MSIPNNIVDLDLSVTSKKKIRFDKDDDRIVYIDTADLGIATRFSDVMPKLEACITKAGDIISERSELTEENAVESVSSIGTMLKELDTEMRGYIDELFDAPVSAAAAPSGSMYDLFEGSFRFEHIISVLLGQYTVNMEAETKKMQAQMQKHTKKYTNGKKK